MLRWADKTEGDKMIYVTSDLHGYPLEKFKEMLEAVGFSSDDFLYVLGDMKELYSDFT